VKVLAVLVCNQIKNIQNYLTFSVVLFVKLNDKKLYPRSITVLNAAFVEVGGS